MASPGSAPTPGQVPGPSRPGACNRRQLSRTARPEVIALVYVARVRNGSVPASRRQVFGKRQSLEVPACPFLNLPERHRSPWEEGLTAEDMRKCVWLGPKLVAKIEFLKWTAPEHLRHSKFVGLWRPENCNQGMRANPETIQLLVQAPSDGLRSSKLEMPDYVRDVWYGAGGMPRSRGDPP